MRDAKTPQTGLMDFKSTGSSRALLVALGMALLASSSGCASLYPVVPNLSDTQAILKDARTEGNRLLTLDVMDARDLTHGIKRALLASIDKRRNIELTASEIAYYGSLIAIGGTLQDSIAAQNTGGGLATLSALFSGRYKTGEQRLAFQHAVDRLTCMEEAVAPIDPAIRETFPGSEMKEELKVKYNAIPGQTTAALRQIIDGLRIELASISLGSPSPEEVKGIYDKWFDAKTAAESKNRGESGPKAKAHLLIAANALPASDAYCEKIDPTKKQQRIACDLRILNQLPETQIADARQRFSVAVDSYAETVEVCVKAPQ